MSEMDPHAGERVLFAGAPLNEAKAAMIMLHGRGADAGDIIGLASTLDREEVAYLAPNAAGNTWYPFPFMTPAAGNEPYLSSALNVVAHLMGEIALAGVPTEKTLILGFSQGACLTLEFAARNPRRYGGIVGLSGGLIGDVVNADAYTGSLAGTPVFLGCSDVDPHIPLARVQQSTTVMRALGGSVTERIYPRMGHTVVSDEAAEVQRMLDAVVGVSD
jgi:predicted esterase